MATKSIIMHMTCKEGNPTGDELIQCSAVYSDDPEHPNHDWSKWTPHAQLEATITNENVVGFFEPGAEYDVVITRRES